MQTVQFFKTKKAALSIVSSLSNTSKMPGLSWGISAKLCKTGAKLAKMEGTVCADCYAMKGSYSMYPAVAAAHGKRLEGYNADRGAWVAAMVRLIDGQECFRWFDSGDLQSPDMLRDILEIVRATPATKHWIATREVMFVKTVMAELYPAGLPANVVIRVSDSKPDAKLSIDRAGITGNVSQVYSKHAAPQAGAHVCPAPTQGGACGDCRACWSKSVVSVTYKIH
jgi:hypothetical protein